MPSTHGLVQRHSVGKAGSLHCHQIHASVLRLLLGDKYLYMAYGA